MGEMMVQQKQTAARRGWLAVAGWIGTGLALFYGHVLVAAIVAAVAVMLTRSWFQFRAKWGMRL